MGIEEEQENNNNNDRTTTLILTYGTLKRGFSNHNLLQDLIRTGDAAFKGTYVTAEKYPLVCGPYRVPFLLNIPGSGHRVTGELYAVSTRGLGRVDELEGTSRGHYERLPIKVLPADNNNNNNNDSNDDDDDGENEESGLTCAEAYYAHSSYDKELWRKNGRKGFETYTAKEAKGYVRRKDRPLGLSFLDHIRIFVSSDNSHK